MKRLLYAVALLLSLFLMVVSVRLGRPLIFAIGIIHVALYGWLLLGSPKKDPPAL